MKRVSLNDLVDTKLVLKEDAKERSSLKEEKFSRRKRKERKK